MKKLLFSLMICFVTILSNAQAPDGMTYQAVIRNANGQLVVNSNVSIRFTIDNLNAQPSTNPVYFEQNNATTNENGLVTVTIGKGIPYSGNFSTIDWSNGKYQLTTSIDPTGNNTYTITTTSLMMSVPYALYAKSSGSGASSGWSLTGNSGTNSATNFIGTTDDKDIIFKRNQLLSGRITDVSGNTAFGCRSMNNNTNGNFNTAIGYKTLNLNTIGAGNTAIGNSALENNTTGLENIAIGNKALYKNTIGTLNVAIGSEALSYTQNNDWNTAIGSQSCKYVQGTHNVGIGGQSLLEVTNNNNNIAVGTTAGPIANYSNTISIGDNANTTASNKVRLGNTAVTSIEGQVGFSTVSDGRFKINVTESVVGLDFIKQLRPVVYNFDTKKFVDFLNKNKHTKRDDDYTESIAIRHTGLIAQEVFDAAQNVGFDFNGVHKPINNNDNWNITYDKLVVPLIKAVQEQQTMIEEQKKLIASLEKRISALEK